MGQDPQTMFHGNFREGQTEQHQFAQNENGDYDENGTYPDGGVDLQVKFLKESRLLLGVASVKDGTGERGVRLESLDYMEKVVITLKESKKIIENKILRAKTLPHMTKGWFKNQREDGVLYMNDPMSNIKGVGKGI